MGKLKYKTTKSEIYKFRELWLKKGFELINLTELCEFKLGHSGSCNDFNEPNEEIYHIQVYYRDEIVANFSASNSVVIDDDRYVIYIESDFNGDQFIIFRKVKINNKGNNK